MPPNPPVLTALQTDSYRYVYKVRGQANMITDSFSSQHQVNTNQGKKRIYIHLASMKFKYRTWANNEPKIFFIKFKQGSLLLMNND